MRLLIIGGAIFLIGLVGTVLIATLPSGASDRAQKKEIDLKKKLIAAAKQPKPAENAVEALQRELAAEKVARARAEKERDHWFGKASVLHHLMDKEQESCRHAGCPCGQVFDLPALTPLPPSTETKP